MRQIEFNQGRLGFVLFHHFSGSFEKNSIRNSTFSSKAFFERNEGYYEPKDTFLRSLSLIRDHSTLLLFYFVVTLASSYHKFQFIGYIIKRIRNKEQILSP